MNPLFDESFFDDDPDRDELRMREFCRHIASQENIDLPTLESANNTTIESLIEFINTIDRRETYGVLDDEVIACLPESFIGHTQTPKTLLIQSLLADDRTYDHLRQVLALTKTRVKLDLSREVREADVCDCGPYEFTVHGFDFFRNKLTPGWGTSPEKAVEYALIYADYFVEQKDAIEVIDTLAGLNDDEVVQLVESVILPNERQQQSAKLRGHAAERMVATPILSAGIPLQPEDKDTNPRSGDIQLDVEDYRQTSGDVSNDDVDSYDLLVNTNDGGRAIGIVSMVHTSILGQYGKDKSETVERYSHHVDQFNSETGENMELWALVDGTGFTQNNYLEGVCEYADGFFQISTQFKLWVRLHQRGQVDIESIKFDTETYTNQEMARLREWAAESGVPTDATESEQKYSAGNATVVLDVDD